MVRALGQIKKGDQEQINEIPCASSPQEIQQIDLTSPSHAKRFIHLIIANSFHVIN